MAFNGLFKGGNRKPLTIKGRFLVQVIVTVFIVAGLLFIETLYRQHVNNLQQLGLDLKDLRYHSERVLWGFSEIIETDGNPGAVKVTKESIKMFELALTDVVATEGLNRQGGRLIGKVESTWKKMKLHFPAFFVKDATRYRTEANIAAYRNLTSHGKIINTKLDEIIILYAAKRRSALGLAEFLHWPQVGVFIFMGLLVYFRIERRLLSPVMQLSETMNDLISNPQDKITLHSPAAIALIEQQKSKPTYFSTEISTLIVSFDGLVDRLEKAVAQEIDSQKYLHNQEELMRLLLESTSEGVIGTGLDGRCTFSNTAGARLFGKVTSEAMKGVALQELFMAAKIDSPAETIADDPIQEVIRTGSPITDHALIKSGYNNKPLRYAYSIHPMSQDHEVVGTVCLLSDITKRWEMEQSNRQLAKAIEYSPVAVVITDVSGLIEYANPAVFRLTGYAPDELVGKNPRILASGKTSPETYHALWQTITSGNIWQGTFYNQNKVGEEFIEAARIAPITDDTGKITHYVAVKEDITERTRVEKQVWKQANFDMLTHLPNRKLFYDRFQQALALSKREVVMTALLFVDLDGFKQVNDTMGHDMGDLLLKQVAKRLLERVRKSDTAARMGGDEFTIILTRVANREGVVKCVKSILKSLVRPFDLDGKEARISASIGIALFPDDSQDGEELLRLADSAMYRVKQEGRNGYLFATKT